MSFRNASTQRVFVALIPTLLFACSWAWAQMEVETEVKRGTVLYAKGNSVLVREPSGDAHLYAPREAILSKEWRPDDIELVEKGLRINPVFAK